ncbi:MAG: hypothetical protein ACTSX9_06210 [Candidatus Njordarchaeales archaeon]
MRKVFETLRKILHDRRGSPITEEALLIGLAIVIFTGILMLVSSIRKFMEDQYQKFSEQFSQTIMAYGFNETNIPDLGTYLKSWPALLEKMLSWLKIIFNYLVYATMFIGGIMILWGAIEWATGYNELSGKKTIVRGIVLVTLALAPILVNL